MKGIVSGKGASEHDGSEGSTALVEDGIVLTDVASPRVGNLRAIRGGGGRLGEQS
ncbi:hypothetical protein [Tumebacillus algifaecis]|uniref:hypothetical protein n=1 Tax=Tumebacillus algifaecis TaxID=1214604 RepID=UPI0012FE57CB|nr:hypothetical protein [Tumebacillus algifaecis]